MITISPEGARNLMLAASIKRIAAVTKLGRLMPTSVIERLDQSNAPPRLTAESVPIPTPTSTAMVSAHIPIVTEIGSDLPTMSFTDHSRYCIECPKLPWRRICHGYQTRNSPADPA